jgi:hypothetical protein
MTPADTLAPALPGIAPGERALPPAPPEARFADWNAAGRPVPFFEWPPYYWSARE